APRSSTRSLARAAAPRSCGPTPASGSAPRSDSQARSAASTSSSITPPLPRVRSSITGNATGALRICVPPCPCSGLPAQGLRCPLLAQGLDQIALGHGRPAGDVALARPGQQLVLGHVLVLRGSAALPGRG